MLPRKLITHKHIALLLFTLLSLILFIHQYAIPYTHIYNSWVYKYKQPSWLPRPSRVPPGGLGTPPFVPELLCSTWPGEYPTPQLEAPRYNALGELVSPALLMLHIPSIGTPKARRRRNLIRSIHLFSAIPGPYRHLVELKFILGRPDTKEATWEEVQYEEREIAMEQASYGDIIRLDDLEGGENMDHGKTIEWVRWVGKRERQARWVIKCDDDMFLILPNLLPLLTGRDASVPTYLGSHTGAFPGTHYHFEGMMYGFNWGVVKTLAEPPLTKAEITKFFPEDGRTGELMYSLPSAPHCQPLDNCTHHFFHTASNFSPPPYRSRRVPRRLPAYPGATVPPHHPKLPFSGDPCDPLTPPGGKTWDHQPPSPDPRTGLVRWDLGLKLGRWDHWWVKKPINAVGYHYLKKDNVYLDVYRQVLRTFEDNGREYMWTPPPDYVAYADKDRHP